MSRLKASPEGERVPVAFRYDVGAHTSHRTSVFKPNSLQGDPRTATLGALWIGRFEHLPDSKVVDVIWEDPGF